MEIIEIRDLEDCFDGSFIKEAILDKPLSKDFIFYLGKEGDFQYYPFERPFFKVDIPDKCILQGVEGYKSIKIILYRKNPNLAMSWLSDFITKF